MSFNKIRSVSAAQDLCADAQLIPSWQLRLGCRITAAALILALLPLLILITATMYFTSDKSVFVRRTRWLGGREQVAVLEYRDSRLLTKTGLIILPMLFEIAAGKHVLSNKEVRVFLRGLRQIVRL